jgi:hypothetical protein
MGNNVHRENKHMAGSPHYIIACKIRGDRAIHYLDTVISQYCLLELYAFYGENMHIEVLDA